MTESGWQAVGRIAKERRERLGLRQDELAQRGGPRVSTVGKFERGVGNFPLRTQHQMEKALGWSRTTIEQVVSSIDDNSLSASDWEHDLIEEDIPDMSGEPDEFMYTAADLDRAVNTMGYVLTLVSPGSRQAAVAAALRAVLPFLDVDGAKALGQGLREAFPPTSGGGDGNADGDTRGSAPMKLRDVSDLEVDDAAYPEDDDEKK